MRRLCRTVARHLQFLLQLTKPGRLAALGCTPDCPATDLASLDWSISKRFELLSHLWSGEGLAEHSGDAAGPTGTVGRSAFQLCPPGEFGDDYRSRPGKPVLAGIKVQDGTGVAWWVSSDRRLVRLSTVVVNVALWIGLLAFLTSGQSC